MAKKHIHLFKTEAQFSNEYTGSAYTEPWVSLTKTVDRVDYNKRPGIIQELWNKLGNTGTLPDKVIINYSVTWPNEQQADTNEPGVGYKDVQNYEGQPTGFNSWEDISASVTGGKYKVVDARYLSQEDLDDPDAIGVYFLWVLDENGWPAGWNENDNQYAIYRENGEWQFWNSSVLKCGKLSTNPDEPFYGWAIYGD